MQEELDEAAALGFRVITGSPLAPALVILLERVATPPDTYQYQLVATSRFSTLLEEMNEATAQGYRLLPQTFSEHAVSFRGDEVVVLLERSPGGSQGYEYRLLPATGSSFPHTEITQAVGDGFVIAGLVSRGGQHMVVMEREVG